MKISFENAQLIGDAKDSLLSGLQAYQVHLREVRDRGDYSDRESSINLPSDTELKDRIKQLAQEKGSGVRHIIVVGIGGSSLGTEALYQALGGRYSALKAELHFVETVEPRQLRAASDLIDSLSSPDEVLLCVISKSGGTVETATNASIIYRSLYLRFGDDAKDRVVVTSDVGSPLSEEAVREGFSSLTIPSVVGGRYSVFSAVGLFPLVVAGVDIDSLLRGANDTLGNILERRDNEAALSAVTLFQHYEWGRRMHDTFVFDPNLEPLGRWYRQLLAESIGKTNIVDETERRVGITPTVSVGSTDLHSVGQLYFGGPSGERFTTFVRRRGESMFTIPENGVFSRDLNYLSGKTEEEVLEALALGAEQAYIDSNLPFVDVLLDGLSEYELGAFMQWKMLEVMNLAKLFEVDPFDQPDVESYKGNARRRLSGSA